MADRKKVKEPAHPPTHEQMCYEGERVAMYLDCVIMLPMFGGYYATEEELKEHRRKCNVVKRRLRKLGYTVDG